MAHQALTQPLSVKQGWHGAARRCLLGAWLVCAPAIAQAPADVRVALVIGNAAYPDAAALANPVNDAAAMAQALRRLGFSVVEARDASRQQMTEAIDRVRQTLQGRQGVGMLYYAGHGMQLDWRNYMLPVDVRLSRAADVPAQGVDVGEVIEAFKGAGNRLNIVVLDACRDNPFPTATSARGLAPVDAPPGTFLAYATAPGNIAQDGTGSNGLYTKFLLQELRKPHTKIEDIFKRVRFQVRQESKGQQVPWESTSLEDDFFFDDGARVPQLAESAKNRLFEQEKAHWDRIKDSRDAADFYAFLQQYPTGSVSELATARLERLEVAQVQPQPDRNGVAQSTTMVWNRVGDRYTFQWKDAYTGVVERRAESRVLRITGEVVEGVSDNIPTRFTQSGEISDSTFGVWDPPLMSRPAGILQVGARFSGRSQLIEKTGRKRWADWQGRVVAAEKVTVPAGTFDTFRIDMTMFLQDGFRVRQSTWLVPGMASSVRWEMEEKGVGTPTRRVRELVAFERGSG